MQKHALCVGINDYPGTGMDLAGCVNDADDWSAMLAARGFTVDRLVDAQATRTAMVNGIRKVVARALPGDLVVITFSGHGTYELDIDGDDTEGFDQALCPHDIETAGQALVDDDIRALFRERRAGVQVVLIADSCHSGSVNRAAADRMPPYRKFLPPASWMPEERLARAAKLGPSGAAPTSVPIGALQPDEGDLLLAGCEDGEINFSYDAQFAGRPNGAFTYYALRALDDLPGDASYADWHAEIRHSLPSVVYPQTPQIAGSASARRRAVLS